jgi:hypothetical protein
MNTENLGALFGSTLAVVRGYNNEQAVDVTEDLIKRGITVVFSGPPCEKTDAWIRDKGLETSPLLIRVNIDDYKRTPERLYDLWCEGLNAGVEVLKMDASKFKYFLPVSGEVLFSEEDLVALYEHMEFNSNVGVTGVTFAAEMPDGTPVALGLSYSMRPRNTFCMWRTSVFTDVDSPLTEGFDTRCNAKMGMEDYHACLKLLMDTSYDVAFLNLKVSLRVGVNHDQNVKELREEAAMQRINVMMQQDGRMLNPAHLQYFVAA